MNARERRPSGGARSPSFGERSGSARPAPNTSADRRGGPGEGASKGKILGKERSPTRRETKAQTQEVLATGVQTLQVDPDEAGMRVDRFLVARFPQLAFTHLQRIVRKGELRVNGKRAKPNARIEAGASVRVPPLHPDAPRPVARSAAADEDERGFLRSITLYEDKDVLVLNKPFGLAVQGGSGTR